MGLPFKRWKEGCGEAGIAGKLPHNLRQVCLILLICVAILIPALTPIPTAAAQVQVKVNYVLIMDDKPVTSISVPVCEEFELEFLIELLNLPEGQGMVGFTADILWDGSQVEFRRIEFPRDEGWRVEHLMLMAVNPDTTVGVHIYGEGPPWTESSVWALLVLHCRGPGTSKIVARSSQVGTVWIGDGKTTSTLYVPTPYDVAVTQYTPPPPPPRPSNPVGGVVYSTGKLAVLAPYIALVGLASVAALVAKRRRR